MNENKEATKQYSLLKNDFFIKRISGKFIISSVISMLFIFAGSLIDTVLIGYFIGENGLAAMSLVSPVYLIYYTFGAAIGIGASILASRVLGQSNMNEYRNIFTCATVTLAALALAMTAEGYLLIKPIVYLLGKNVSAEVKQMATDYIRMYIPGGAFTLLSYIPLYFLKTEGRPKASSRLFTASAVINVVFSALLMSPLFNMGVAGASLATSFSMGIVTILGFIIMLKSKHKTELRFVKKSFSLKRLRDIIKCGIPNGVNNLLGSTRIMLINTLIITSGASALLPCYTVIRNVSDVLGSVNMGISYALIPLIGVFFGERDYEGVRSIMKHAIKIGIIVVTPLVIIASFIPNLLFVVFGVTDPVLIEEGKTAIPLAIFGIIAAYINILYVGELTAVKRETFATILVALRLFVMLTVTAVPLSFIFGTAGIWISLSLSEILTTAAFIIIRSVIRKKKPQIDQCMIDTSKAPASDINFSVRNNVDDIVFATEQISLFCEDNDIDMRHTMKVSLAIEEILTFLNQNCLSDAPDSYTDVRVCKLDDEVMIRFRYVGKIYDPTAVYKDNEDNEEMAEALIGLKMIMKSASLVNFRQTLGANNLMIIF